VSCALENRSSMVPAFPSLSGSCLTNKGGGQRISEGEIRGAAAKPGFRSPFDLIRWRVRCYAVAVE
jgi:hypothetical protein